MVQCKEANVRLKKVLMIFLLGLMLTVTFSTTTMIAPEEVEAFIPIIITPVDICCWVYATEQCPDPNVHHLCFWDCVDNSCGWE